MGHHRSPFLYASENRGALKFLSWSSGRNVRNCSTVDFYILPIHLPLPLPTAPEENLIIYPSPILCYRITIMLSINDVGHVITLTFGGFP